MPNYQLGKIYKIVCNITKEQYIGSTCEPTLARRLAGHKGAYRDWLNDPVKYDYISSYQIIERNNYQIVLLESCPCNNKDELRMKEREWFDKIQNINTNKPFVTVEEVKDRKKQYREEHKKEINEYYQKHKEEIIKKAKERFTCECGGKYTVQNKSNHFKTIKHQNFIKNNI